MEHKYNQNRGRFSRYPKNRQNSENWRAQGLSGASHFPDNDRFDQRNKKFPSSTYSHNKAPDDHQDPSSNRILKEIEGDLFDAPKEYSLAHCVASDLRMGSGIAIEFRKQFKSLSELYNQKAKVGGFCFLEREGRFIYYLVTKKYSYEKPKLDDLRNSLYAMKKHCIKHNVLNIAIPRIGCGLDRLKWDEVSEAIVNIFKETDIKFLVYNLKEEEKDEDEEEKETKYINTKYFKIVERTEIHLNDLEKNSILLFFTLKNKKLDKTFEEINKKYQILSKYKSSNDMVTYDYKSGQYIYIIDCKDEHNSIDFQLLEKGFKIINKELSKDKNLNKTETLFFGFQYFIEKDDDIISVKIANLLKICCLTLKNPVECHICKKDDPN